MKRLTKRFIISSLCDLSLSKPIRYERYYINDTLRVQKKDSLYQKEILDNNNNVIDKINISKKEFVELSKQAYSKIIRDSYLCLDDKRISIKKNLDKYEGLFRVEIVFNSIEEMNNYVKENWMGDEITNSPLAFDKYLSKLSKEEFNKELKKFLSK